MSRSRHLMFILLASLGVSGVTHAANDYVYPELAVTPLASERLKMESEDPANSGWRAHLPVQVSALATTAAGISLLTSAGNDPTSTSDDNRRIVGLVAAGFGVGWLATTAVLASSYEPYQRGLSQISSLPARTDREKLIRERLSEETIRNAAAAGRRLSWISFATNLAASAAVAGTAESDSLALWAGIGGAALSFTPLIFRYNWQKVADYHENYKKRIYGPVASIGPAVAPDGRTLVTALSLGLRF